MSIEKNQQYDKLNEQIENLWQKVNDCITAKSVSSEELVDLYQNGLALDAALKSVYHAPSSAQSEVKNLRSMIDILVGFSGDEQKIESIRKAAQLQEETAPLSFGHDEIFLNDDFFEQCKRDLDKHPSEHNANKIQGLKDFIDEQKDSKFLLNEDKVKNIVSESMRVYKEIYDNLPKKLLGKHTTSNALKSIREVFKGAMHEEGGTHRMLMKKNSEPLQDVFWNYAQDWQKNHEPPSISNV